MWICSTADMVAVAADLTLCELLFWWFIIFTTNHTQVQLCVQPLLHLLL